MLGLMLPALSLCAAPPQAPAVALSGRFAPRTDLPDWLRAPRWATTDLPLWEPGKTAELIDGYADRHANAMRFGTYWGGLAMYPSPTAPHHFSLRPGTDPLAEALTACRRRGLHLIAYLNPNAFYTQSPLYEQACLRDEAGRAWEVKAYGREGTRYACLNHPAWQAFYRQAVGEVIARGAEGIYVDGLSPHVCYCEYCRAKYRRDTGHDLPPGLTKLGPQVVMWEMTSDLTPIGDPHDPELARYTRWLMGNLAEGTRLFADAAHAANPRAVVTFHTWPKPPTEAHYDATLNEIYARQPWLFTLWKRAEFANWGDAFDVPMLVNIYLRQIPWQAEERPVQSEVEARHLYWQVLANGGYPNAWNYLGAERPFEVLERHADVYDFATTLPTRFLALPRPMFEDGRHQRVRREDPWPTGRTDRFLSPPAGLYAGVLHAGLPVKELHPNHLTAASLAGFRVLALAGEACLDEAQLHAVREFVAAGGGLLVTGETSRYDGDGARRPDLGLADVLGCRLVGTVPGAEGQTVTATGADPAIELPTAGLANHEPHLQVTARDATIAAVLHGPGVPAEGVPAVLLNRFGQGRVAYLPGRLDADYSATLDPGWPVLIGSLVRWLAQGRVPAWVEPGSGHVGLTSFDQPSRHRRLIHLVNLQADPRAPFDSLTPLADVRVALEEPERIGAVRTVLGGQALTVERAGDHAVVTLPRLDEYEVLEVVRR